LEAQRERGADFLLFPRTALWWLDHYGGLRQHLERHYRVLSSDENCRIFDLTDRQSRLLANRIKAEAGLG
jgi:hypothetical protein